MVLVIAEIQHGAITQGTYAALNAAQLLSETKDVLVIGFDCMKQAQALAQVKGIRKVIVADHKAYEHGLSDNITPLVVQLSEGYSALIAASSSFSKNVMPQVAALKNVMLISDVIKIINKTTFQRPIYAGNAIATVTSTDPVQVITIRATAFESQVETGNTAPIEQCSLVFEDKRVVFKGCEIPELERPDLTSAKIVVSGGRGLQSKENFKKIEALADKLGAAVGASRAAVDAGFVPNDCQVGQTGKIVAPDLYFAIGISGAIQHLAGMKNSKIIVAINSDPEAPIFQVADYGLVMDLFTALSELDQQL